MGRQTGAGAGPAGRAGAGSRGQTFGGRVRFRGRGRGRGGSSSRGRGGKAGANGDAGPSLQTEDGTKDDDRAEDAAARDEIDEKLGFGRISAGPPKVGWLVNMSATTIRDEAFPAGRAGASTRSQRCSSARRRLLLHRGERQHGASSGSRHLTEARSSNRRSSTSRISSSRSRSAQFNAERADRSQKGTENQVEEWLMRKYEGPPID